MQFVFIITAYNVADWYKRNLESVFAQTYKKYRVIYVDDFSSDNTVELISSYKIELISNKERRYQAYNRWIAFNLCNDNEICVMLDGDDWLIDQFVLEHLNCLYNENDIVCTYGQFQVFYNGDVSKEIYTTRSYPKSINYRKHDFIAYHCRTGYAKLFKSIPVNYLMYNNQWINQCTDVAEMLCVLELSNGKHMNASRPLYIYNKQNSIRYLNSPFINNERKDIEKYFRSLKPLRGGLKC